MSARDLSLHKLVGTLFWLLAGCSEASNAPPIEAPNAPLKMASSTIACSATYRMITEETDSLMAPYGIPNSVDTVDVCEGWTGSDYQYQATAIGSSDDVQPFVDSVQTTIYQNGAVTGYTPSGNTSGPAAPVGATAFDMVFASSSMRQASYDYPYYGISSPDPSACLQPPCPIYSRAAITRAGGSAPPTSSSALSAPPVFAKHGLSRRGIRALVDDDEEIQASSEGNRRFQTTVRDQTIIRSIDPKTELLVGEETQSPNDSSVTVHYWTKVAGGYVREHSEFQSIEHESGKRLRNKGRITFQRVRINDPAFPLMVGPDVAR